MSQTYGFPVTLSATTQAAFFQAAQDAFDALDTTFYGTSAPPHKPGRKWIDSSGATKPLKMSDGTTWHTVIPNAFSTSGGLVSATAGAFTTAAPTSAIAASSSTHLVRKSEVDAITLGSFVHVGTISVTDQMPIFGGIACTIVDVAIINENGIASSGTDFWTFQVRNMAGAVDLRSSAKSTNGSAITADTLYALGLDQNLTLTASQTLELQMTKGGAASNLQELGVMVKYRVSV